jgi:hypothetical protein
MLNYWVILHRRVIPFTICNCQDIGLQFLQVEKYAQTRKGEGLVDWLTQMVSPA